MEGEGSEPKPNGYEADVLAYCKTVNDKFRNDPAKYDTFLMIFRNFKAQRIDHNTCLKELEKLFNGHQDLISGFNKFMPEDGEGNGSELKPSVKEEEDAIAYVDALTYLKTVKHKFRNDPAKYDTFLTILNNFRTQRIDENTCIKEVEKLFNGDQDLISGFDKFLPEDLKIGEGDGVVIE